MGTIPGGKIDGQGQPSQVRYSPDGLWWWDGTQWQPVQYIQRKNGAGFRTAGQVFFGLAIVTYFYAVAEAKSSTCIDACVYGAFFLPVLFAILGAGLLTYWWRKRR